MTTKRFFESGRALCAAVSAAALFALIGCSSPGGNESGPPTLISITVETSKDVYIQGEALKPDTITITGTYSDGTTQKIDISDAVITGYDKTKAGTQTITVTAEGKSDTFTVTVKGEPEEAKEILNAALEDALNIIEDIIVSPNGDGVPEGLPWLTPAQKKELEDAIEAARALAASGEASVEAIAAALEELEQAVAEAAAHKEEQTGTATEWSYAVAFNANGGGGDPEIKIVASPATRVDSLPADPSRSAYAFSGWNTAADGSGSAFTETTPVIANITVYAQWAAIVNAQAPVISSQPRSAAYLLEAAAAALSVTAISRDNGQLSYQWHSRGEAAEEWTAIADATAASYTPPTDSAGLVSYYVKVTNTNNEANGTKTASTDSNAAVITVNLPVDAQQPVISAQPQGGAYTVGEAAAALSVTAESPDGGVLSYQWHSFIDGAWTAIEGAARSSYTPSTAAAGSVSYYVKVTNTNNGASGTKTAFKNSETAQVTVTVINAKAPVISVQPQDASCGLNETAALSVTAASPDGGVLSYQWHGSAGGAWAPIEGATAASYRPPTDTMGSVSYYVRITNTHNAASGTKTAVVNSEAATVAVVVNAQEPLISVQPLEAAYALNATAAPLSVAATSPDGGALSYQWHHYVNGGWAAISGAAGTSYTPPTGEYGSVSYYVRITNTNDSVNGVKAIAVNSNTVTVTVARVNAQAPVISAQPLDAAYLPNDTADPLTVAATSPDGGSLSYQWHKRDEAAVEWEAINGASSASYTPSTLTLGKVYYYVLITNTNNTVDGVTSAAQNSAVATVTITTLGSSSLVFKVWADGNSLISNMPENTDISRSLAESLTFTAAEDLTNLQWSINNITLPDPGGKAQSITIEAVNYPVGNFTLGLYAEKNGVPHSINITFIVDN
jgi:uncharacterized repeat protein (TIGR02543 family)